MILNFNEINKKHYPSYFFTFFNQNFKKITNVFLNNNFEKSTKNNYFART